jgi:hypothetical protein
VPRKISDDITFDDAEDEIGFTVATLKADPDAQDFVGETEDWMGQVDEARAKDRAARHAVMETDAARIVANRRLDIACMAFGDDLRAGCGKDSSSTRFRQFFPVSPARFVRQALGKQVTKVRAWLGANEPLLEKHRAALTTWSQKAGEALERTDSSALVRGGSKIARERMADALTRERDGLHELLAERARDRGLPRDWPDMFFRVASRSRSMEATPAEPSPPSPAPPNR